MLGSLSITDVQPRRAKIFDLPSARSDGPVILLLTSPLGDENRFLTKNPWLQAAHSVTNIRFQVSFVDDHILNNSQIAYGSQYAAQHHRRLY